MGAGSGGNFGNTKGSHSHSNKNQRFNGKPGDIIKGKNKWTRIGDKGKEILERHFFRCQGLVPRGRFVLSTFFDN